MTKADVFIVESLRFRDEKKKRLEGLFLSQILHLGGKKAIYYYIRTRKELERVLKEFRKSDYRYLHLSCHGNEESLSTTLDNIEFSDFSKIVGPYLRNRRLFVSSCSSVNESLAESIIPSSGCISIVGPCTDIEFSDAAIIWASFYHLVFKAEENRMTDEAIECALQKAANAFEVAMNYCSKSKSKKKGYKCRLIEPSE